MLAWLVLTATYSLRGDFRLGVGELGDSPYLSGFNGDEAGTPRARWTGGLRLGSDKQAVGVVTLPWPANPGVSNVVRVTLRAIPNQPPPEVTLSFNGSVIGHFQPDPGVYKTVEYSLPRAATGGDSTRIEIRSAANRPPGDGRYLGVQVSEVTLFSAPGLRRPPLDAFLWGWLYVAAVGLLLLRVAGSEYFFWSVGAGAALLIPAMLLPVLAPAWLNLWYVPYLLPGLALLLGLVDLLVYRQAIGDWLAEFMVRLESSPGLARNILLAVLAIYTLYAFSIIIQMDYIGHADYADNAVAARSIVQGRGYSLDYTAQFYQNYTLPRPADTWPPLQPFLIVPFYLLFGPTVWAAKLPNLLLVPLLAWLIFRYGTRLFNRRTGLFAALLALFAVMPAFSSSPALFETIAYPINDLAFTIFTFLVILDFGLWILDYEKRPQPIPATYTNPYTATSEEKTPPRRWQTWLKSKIENRKSKIALWAGLLFLSKPSGAILLVVLAGWALWRKYGSRLRLALPWRDLLIVAGLALLVISPYLLRNQLQFGAPYRSTEQYDTWVTKWNPPDEHIYDLYTVKGLPNPRQLLEYGFDNDFNAIANQFRRFFGNLLDGQLFAPLALLLAALGWFGLSRRRSWLGWLLGLGLLVYIIFINVYWHYEARYFLAWLPFVCLLAAYGLGWLYDKMSEQPERRGAALLLVLAALAILLVPNVLNLVTTEGPGYTTRTGIVVTAEWLRDNTPPDAVVMSRNVWELSFHSQRRSVMVPNNATFDQIKQVMRQYGATYLELDHLDARGVNEQWGQRQALWDLLDAPAEYKGFSQVYNQNGLLVYQWNGR